MNQSRTEVDSSRRSAWAFARLRLIGYPQYLRMRRRCKLSTFSFVYYQIKDNNNLKPTIMKRVLYLSMKMLLLMMLPMMVACGGDDDNGSGKKVDGVNVTNGKRIKEVYYHYNNTKNLAFKVEYDTKGRITSILFNGRHYDYNQKIYVEDFYEVAKIDYDLRALKVYDSDYTGKSDVLGFALNESGFISQIGTCTLKYDSKGYLIGVDEPRGISTLAYDANDLIKASVTTFRKGKMYLYYVTYGNDDSQGDLYINIRYADHDLSEIRKLVDYVGLIAYQAGLFGRVSKSFMNLKDRDEASSLFEFQNDRKSESIKLTFIYE